jgi:hypothetical protein
MKTIYTTNNFYYSFEDGADAFFNSTSHEADEVHRRPRRLRRVGDTSAGVDDIIRDGSVTLAEVVNKYLPDNTALTAEWKVKSLYITGN